MTALRTAVLRLQKRLGLCYKGRALMKLSLIRTVQRLAVFIGIAVAVFLAYYGGLNQIGALEVAAYQAFWGILMWVSSAWRVI